MRRYKLYEAEYYSADRLVKYICSDKELFAENFDEFDLDVVDYGDFSDYYHHHSSVIDSDIVEDILYFREENKPICDGNFNCYFVYITDLDVYEGTPRLFTFYKESEMIEKIRQLYNRDKIWSNFVEFEKDDLRLNNLKKSIKGMSPEEIESFIDVDE